MNNLIVQLIIKFVYAGNWLVVYKDDALNCLIGLNKILSNFQPKTN